MQFHAPILYHRGNKTQLPTLTPTLPGGELPYGQITIDNLKDADVDRIYLTNQGAYNDDDNDTIVANNNICIRTDGGQYWIGPQGGREEHWIIDDNPGSYSISGRISFFLYSNNSGRSVRYGLRNIQVNLYSGNPEVLVSSTRTDRDGYYRFYNITGGRSYRITPNQTTGWRFIPASRQITALTSDMGTKNFTAILSNN